uniref:Mitochondrial carrier protein n=1 Tax=Setaria digitata TaxID=48799 RepID=A0A915PWY9_9BILA
MVGYGTHELTSFEYSEAGLISGIAARFLIQPLDVLKIRFQLQREPTFGQTKGRYCGILQACSLIYKDEGLAAFWKGHVPAQGLSAVYGIVQFATFEYLTKQALRYPCNVSWNPFGQLFANENRRVTDIICGALSGCAGMTSALPFDVIRTRLIIQKQHKVYNGTFHAVISIWNSEGFRGFFRGITPSLAQIAPYIGLQFCFYNALSTAWQKLPHHLGSVGPLFCGALAGVISKTAVYPLDIVRHRLQAHCFNQFNQLPWGSMYSIIVNILRDEKITGLFKGLWPSQLKAACSSGFAFMFYEICLDILHELKSR